MIASMVKKIIGTNPAAGIQAYAGDISAWQAWDMLTDDGAAVLVDVRTLAEWQFVGRPDLAKLGKTVTLVPWVNYPDMARNPNFIADVEVTGAGREAPILLLCRSGQRSAHAAMALTAAGFSTCYNIIDGFEGHHDAHGHRGANHGWKALDLPWIQD